MSFDDHPLTTIQLKVKKRSRIASQACFYSDGDDSLSVNGQRMEREAINLLMTPSAATPTLHPKTNSRTVKDNMLFTQSVSITRRRRADK